MNKEALIAPGTWFEMTGKEAIVLVLLAMVILLVAAVLVVAVWAMRALLGPGLGLVPEKQPQAEQSEARLSVWAWLDRKFITAAVPIEQEQAIILHHDYDGIRELDNHLPPWWKGLFYATIAFAVVYLLVYHTWHSAPLQAEELAIEKQQAAIALAAYQAKTANAIDETNVTLAANQKDIDEGHELFLKNCKVCHGDQGQGGVGPNLTDTYWLHGGSVKDVFKSIKYGIPQKGMIAWKASFKPNEIRSIASYVLSLQGTSPPNPKAPQGDKYVPAGGTPAGIPGADTANAVKPVGDSLKAMPAPQA